jgi:hypothetical protein
MAKWLLVVVLAWLFVGSVPHAAFACENPPCPPAGPRP